MLKKSIFVLATAALVLQSVPAFADQWGGRGEHRQDRREDRRDNRQEFRKDHHRHGHFRHHPRRHFTFWRGGHKYVVIQQPVRSCHYV